MRGVGVCGREHDLRVRRQFDFADTDSFIGHRDPADFRIVFARHEDLGRSEDATVPAGDFRAILEKCDFIAVRFASDGLISGRPNLAADHIAQEDVAAPGVTSRVLAPAGHGDAPPPAISGSGGGQHHGIVSVRQQMCARRDVMRGGESARCDGCQFAEFGRRLSFVGTLRGQVGIAGGSFLQEQLSRLNGRIRVKV